MNINLLNNQYNTPHQYLSRKVNFKSFNNKYFISFVPLFFISGLVLNFSITLDRDFTILKYGNITEYIVLFLFLSLSIFAFLKVNHPQYLHTHYKSVVTFTLLRRKGVYNKYVPFLLHLQYLLNLSFIILFFLDYLRIYIIENNPLTSYMLILFSISGYYVLKNFLYKVISSLFLQKKYIEEFLENAFLYNHILGIALIPFIVVIPFLNVKMSIIALFIALFLCLIIILVRYLNGIRIIVQKGFSLFYLILYLCILELVPLWVAYKLGLQYLM